MEQDGKGVKVEPKDYLEKKLPEHVFRLWFEEALFFDDRIEFPNAYSRDKVAKYKDLIIEAYGGSSPELVVVEKVVEEVVEGEDTPKLDTKKLENHTVAMVIFPVWANSERASPSEIAGTEVFTARRSTGVKKSRELLNEKPISAPSEYRMRYTGELLTQEDYDVWLEALHLARGKTHDFVFIGSTRELLLSLGRTCNSREYKRLRKSLKRLRKAVIEIKKIKERKKEPNNRFKKGTWTFFNLLKDIVSNDDDRSITVAYDRKFVEFFSGGMLSKTDIDNRRSLGQDDLAKWVLDYYSKNKNPYDVKVSTLHERSCIQCDLKQFKFKLKKVLPKLSGITGNEMYIYGRGKDSKVRVINNNNTIAIAEKDDFNDKLIPNELPSEWKKAAKFAAKLDLYAIFEEWKDFNSKNGKPLENPKGAFIGFCRSKICG